MTTWIAANIKPRWAWLVVAAAAIYDAIEYNWVERMTILRFSIAYPYALTHGYVLYDNLVTFYAPLWIWFQIILYQLIPDHLVRLRVFQIVIMVGSIVLVAWWASKWRGPRAGAFAALVYAAWAPLVMSTPLYYDAVVGVLVLVAAIAWHDCEAGWRRPLVAGLCLGAAVMVKQQSLAPLAVFVIWRGLSLWVKNDWRKALGDIALLLAGALIIPGAIGIYELSQGNLQNTLYWMWVNPIRYPVPGESPDFSEVVMQAAWLVPVIVYAWTVIRNRAAWRGYPILLVGLVVGLYAPAIQRYTRTHTGSEAPIIAVITALVLVQALETAGKDIETWKKNVLRAFSIGVAGVGVIALLLPWWYLMNLGPRNGSMDTLPIVVSWMKQSGVPAGARVYMLPEADPTDNLHALGGYLPPTFSSQTYPWDTQEPRVIAGYLHSLDETPPPYALFFTRFRDATAKELVDYLESHYTEITETQGPRGTGQIILYKRNP